jgi:hypothetical protein
MITDLQGAYQCLRRATPRSSPVRPRRRPTDLAWIWHVG